MMHKRIESCLIKMEQKPRMEEMIEKKRKKDVSKQKEKMQKRMNNYVRKKEKND